MGVRKRMKLNILTTFTVTCNVTPILFKHRMSLKSLNVFRFGEGNSTYLWCCKGVTHLTCIKNEHKKKERIKMKAAHKKIKNRFLANEKKRMYVKVLTRKNDTDFIILLKRIQRQSRDVHICLWILFLALLSLFDCFNFQFSGWHNFLQIVIQCNMICKKFFFFSHFAHTQFGLRIIFTQFLLSFT